MRKLLILVLVSITAFLGVNLTKVSTYAATSDDVTYVVEGNRIYVEFGSLAQNDHSFLVDNTSVRSVYADGLILFDIPYYAESMHVEYLDNGQFVEITADMYDFSDHSILQPKFIIWYDSVNSTYYSYVGENNADLFEWNVKSFIGDYIRIYFQMPETIQIDIDLTYNHATDQGILSSVINNAQYLLLRYAYQNIVSMPTVLSNYQDEMVTVEYESYGTYNNLDYISFLSAFGDGAFLMRFYENGNLIFEADGRPKDGSQNVFFDFEFNANVQPPITASDAEFITQGNRAYLAFNGETLIDVNNLAATLDTFEIDIPDNVIGLYIADEFGSVVFDWNNTGYDLELQSISGYDSLYIVTRTAGIDIDVEGTAPYVTQMLLTYEEGLFPYGMEGYTKFYVYFELIPFENSVPIITGDTLVVNIDNPLPEATLRAEISAWDDLDGDITANLVLVGGTYESARLAGTLVVGNTYTIIYEVEDSSSNVTQATINVQVVDITKPVFGISNTTTQISYTQTLNLESFKANLLVTDNYDDTEDIVINILTNTYTANKLVPGSYTVVYRAIDTSTNYRDISITVVVIDDVGPVITGPNSFNVPLSPKTNISLILNQFTATDAIDGNVTSSIEVLSDTYTAAATPGIYSVTIRFTDESGNTTNKTFTISMADGVPPILFITSGLLIGVNELQTLTVQQIITLLESQGTITGFTVLSNTYAGNEKTPGTYQMVVAYTQNNVQYQQTLSILVTPSQLLQWTVSFITNGGSNLASVIVNDFGQLLIQAPSRTGYRFVGWYKDAELTQPFSMVTGRITQDTTLYAKWVPIGTAGPSIIIDNISNLKLADILIIVGTIAVGIGVGFYFATKKKPTSKRKRG